jgi:cell division protein FtsQ
MFEASARFNTRYRSSARTMARKRARWNLLKRLGWKTMLCGVSAVFLVFGGLYAWNYLAHSYVFCIQSIRIEPSRHLNEEEILKLSGLSSTTNILNMDVHAVERAVEANPWVEKASVERRFPSAVHISVKEHVPVAVVSLGNKAYMVNASGVLFRELNPSEPTDGLPVITGLKQDSVRQGRLPAEAINSMELLKMAQKGARTLGVGNIKEIHVSESGELTVYTVDKGVPILFSATDVKQQFARAENILFHLYKSGNYDRLQAIDLDYGKDRAVARLK